jgi:uncharacterized protein YwgA
MERLPRSAILLTLLEQLQAHGSWCGETHVQKSVYFVQELLGIPVDFDFLFYKYGPFSFELSNELTALQGDGLLKVVIRDPQYGPSLLPTPASKPFLERFPKTRQRYSPAIQFIAERLGPNNVAELERLATALYVIRQNPDASRDEHAYEINRLKPHVSQDEAVAALQRVEKMQAELKALKFP